MRHLMILFVVIFSAANGQQTQYECQESYNPDNYKGSTRVPTTCREESLDCPRSWKAGVSGGKSTSTPLIDLLFVQCHEGFLCCGYVPIDSKNGEVLGQSGVTVGSGVDLGSKDKSYFTGIVSSSIIAQVEPYLGLKRNDAACAAIERPLDMSCYDAAQLTSAVKDDIVSQVQTRYNAERKGDAEIFSALPRGIRTAIADVWFQFGFPNAYPIFWGYVTENDWENAIKELRNFYSNPNDQQTGDLQRRNNEADIIEAALAKCNRSADIVFLVDESGSISSFDFSSSLNFMESVINAFPDQTLQSANGTRFGLSLFTSGYRVRFVLSAYKSRAEYSNSLSSVNQISGGTNLGFALSNILDSQFTEQNGLRPEQYGFPKVLIVMTDGQSSDEVAAPAAIIRANNIVIYAIGIGSYDEVQLKAVASSDKHVIFLNAFSDLSEFAATLTAETCSEPQPLSLEKTITGSVGEDEFQYYTFDVPEQSNLMVEVGDVKGSTIPFASRDNPHPYEYDNDVGFQSGSVSDKILVISPRPTASDDTTTSKRQQVEVNVTYPIYVSVKGAGGESSFHLVGSLCDPTVCSEGTNKAISLVASISVNVLFVVMATALFFN